MTTTAGERILADRPEASAHFPAIPDAARILEDRSSEPNARFIQVAADGLAEFDAATWYAGDRPTNLHEHGHENEERLARARVAAGLAPSLYEAKRAIRRELFAFRGFPDADVVQTEVDAGAYGPVGSQGWWQYSPCEIVAESFSRGILGAPSTERTADWGRTIDHDAQLSWWKDRWRDLGVEVPAVRTFTFSLALDGSGRADAIGASAISLTEAQRAALRLASGRGRSYAVDIQRVGLTGTETTLPDARGWVTEDTSVAIGLSGRWKLSAMVRRDYGSVGWYEARFSDVTGVA